MRKSGGSSLPKIPLFLHSTSYNQFSIDVVAAANCSWYCLANTSNISVKSLSFSGEKFATVSSCWVRVSVFPLVSSLIIGISLILSVF